jgi:hypothetical protein
MTTDFTLKVRSMVFILENYNDPVGWAGVLETGFSVPPAVFGFWTRSRAVS